jgi:prolyl-tRNA editing enzyme YbaK/EbsC (Cys-tRNA(Pro) deacylase)
MCSNTFKVHPPSDNPSRANPHLLEAVAPRGREHARYVAAMSEHPAITRFRTELEARGGQGRIVVLPDSVHTAQLAADALGCEVGAIANSLLFTVPTEAGEGDPLLLLTSGAHRVDTGKVAAELGIEHLRRAKPDFVRTHTGQVIGGVSPFDHPAPVRTYLDPWLRRHDEIWAAAGHPAAVFSSTF